MTTAQETTIANTDIWSKYFQDQWGAMLDPFGLRRSTPVAQVADGTAARVAGFLTLVAAGPIAWLFNDHASQFTPTEQAAADAPLGFPHDAESLEDAA